MPETNPSGGPCGPPTPLRHFLVLWTVALGAAVLAAVALPRYGVHVAAFGFLYAALATSWSWTRSTGLFSFGQAAFFGAGALTQAWLVTSEGFSPWLALLFAGAAGALAALPLIPALRLGPPSFALATLAYAILLKGLAGNVSALGMEGFLLPPNRHFDGASAAVVSILALLALISSLGYQAFLRRPSGRASGAIRQAPETALSLGIDPIGERWRPLTLSAAVTGLGGALYAHLVGSVETSVVFSPTFSVLPIVLGMLGGALHPLGGLLGTLALYPLDELILRPALPHTHTLAYGLALVGLLLIRPRGLLKAPVPRIPASSVLPPIHHDPFAIAVAGLTVRRNGADVLRDVSFSVEPGQVLKVRGANGAGKTSLLLAIAGRLPVAAGAVFLGGTSPPRAAASRARCGLARSFQTPRPWPEWTVRENIGFAAERSNSLEEVDRLLEELDLTALKDRPAGLLSVGEGKRLELARVLASRPAVLLLDEPLAGLSPDAAKRASALIERERRQGRTVVWVEHGPAAGDAATRVLVLEGGRVRFLGPLAGWEAAHAAPPQ
jgi:ABC-type multidrug transport system ATPase subunit/ABC-type branched-subunit amino acid transport system permease subunit